MDQNLLKTELNRLSIRLNHNVGRQRLFVWIGNSGKTFELPRKHLLVESFNIPLGEDRNRALHEDLNELDSILRNREADLIADRAIRRDGCGDRADAVAREQPANVPDP